MGDNRAIQKYLRDHSEQVIDVAPRISEAYETALVVPIYNEGTAVVPLLLPQADSGSRHLVILVVNQPAHATAADAKRSATFLECVSENGENIPLSPEVNLVCAPFSRQAVDVLLVDATKGRYALKPKEGVGRARKMGFDLALALYRSGKLAVPYVGSTDADVEIPTGYVESLTNAAALWAGGSTCEHSALLFPYRHIASPDDKLRQAMTAVELGFRYYVLGLAYAGSPYAYHSLGSALAVSLPHYAEVRGVPNRQAGEDFYLLSKLSKLAPLRRLPSPTISITTRVSTRVPFGTGPALERALREANSEVMSYHPAAFGYLRVFLEQLVRCARGGQGASGLQFEPHVPIWVKDTARSFLESMRPHLASCPTPAHRDHRVHERFDALRTLQFVHRAHREGLIMLPITQAIEQAGFLAPPPGALAMLNWCRGQEEALTDTPGLFPAS